jgi:hypothetical protein
MGEFVDVLEAGCNSVEATRRGSAATAWRGMSAAIERTVPTTSSREAS